MISMQAAPISSRAVSSSRRPLRAARAVESGSDEFYNARLPGSIKPLLPQNDLGGAGRTVRLDERRTRYILDQRFIPPFALAKDVPGEDWFSMAYIIQRILSLIGNLNPAFNPNLVGNITASKPPEEPDAPFDEFDADYRRLFHPGIPFFGFEVPKIAETYKLDAAFAAQRTSGPNPVMIKALKAEDARAGVLKLVDSKNFPTGFNLDTELGKGNLFLCDYTGTDPTYRGPSVMTGAGKHPYGVKSLPKPLAFFWWNGQKGLLLPIAIQLDCSKDANSYVPTGARVYTPKEKAENDWFFAKTCVQIADGNHHEMSTHLTRTHLVIEPIAIAAMRQLDTSHPIGIMLRVHCRYLIANNALAHFTFFKEVDGTLEQLMAGSFNEIKALLGSIYEAWDLNSSALPADLKARGVDASSTLKSYPFRDYALMLWDAIKDFVTAYVNHFYTSDADLDRDYELKAWAAECADQGPTGAKVKGFPEKFTTNGQLIDVLTNIIFTSGPMHSAVNFSQQDMMFVPHYPLSAYVNVGKLIAQKEPITNEQLLELLPPFTAAQNQINVLGFLTSYRFDSLGDWDKSLKEMYKGKSFEQVFAGDDYAPVRTAMERFQSDLKHAEDMMNKANKNENSAFPYPYLLPSKVLNSISI